MASSWPGVKKKLARRQAHSDATKEYGRCVQISMNSDALMDSCARDALLSSLLTVIRVRDGQRGVLHVALDREAPPPSPRGPKTGPPLYARRAQKRKRDALPYRSARLGLSFDSVHARLPTVELCRPQQHGRHQLEALSKEHMQSCCLGLGAAHDGGREAHGVYVLCMATVRV